MSYYVYDNYGNSSVCYQCAAFAKLCYKTFNGSDVPYLPDANATNLVTLTTSNLYSYLQSMGPYSYVRGLTSSGAPHSIFVVSYSMTNVTIYHANNSNKCDVLYETISYSSFVNKMERLRFYYTSDGDYVSF